MILLEIDFLWIFISYCLLLGELSDSKEQRTLLLKKCVVFQWASSSVYYLLGLWSRLVSSVPFLKGDAPSLLDEFVPKITEGFITSRLDSAQVWLSTKTFSHPQKSCIIHISCFSLLLQTGLPDDISEHPLDNVDLLQDQLDCFPSLCRFQVKSDFDRVIMFFIFLITLLSFVTNITNFLFSMKTVACSLSRSWNLFCKFTWYAEFVWSCCFSWSGLCTLTYHFMSFLIGKSTATRWW